MEDYSEILIQHLSEQIALEEHICKIIEDQIADLEGSQFSEVRQVLKKTINVLENNFQPLNLMLSKLEKGASSKPAEGKALGLYQSLTQTANGRRISRMLRDDYSALNQITMSNTLLHTTALVLKHADVAQLALTHLQRLAPLVVKLGEIVPSVVFAELNMGTKNFDTSVAEIALLNTRNAWRGIE